MTTVVNCASIGTTTSTIITTANTSSISSSSSSGNTNDNDENTKKNSSGSTIPSRTSGTVFEAPPVYDDICRFIAEYAGRLPRNVFTGTAPYEYTGCDYALILYAILPSRCIDLSRLCWSTTPLPFQLETNLVVFCEGARGLELCDAPSSSLHPQHLRVTPGCIVHHIRVQHWLYVLSQRFRPEGSFDPVTLRMELRHIQLGEPRLTGTTTATGVGGRAGSPLALAGVSTNAVNGEEAFCFPSFHCNTLWKVAAVGCRRTSTEVIQATRKRAATEGETQENHTKKYSRPWRAAPSGAAGVQSNIATTTKVSSRLPQQKQQTVQTSSTACEVSPNTLKATSQLPLKSLAEQWSECEERWQYFKETLEFARNTTQSMLFVNGSVDFENILSILHRKQQ